MTGEDLRLSRFGIGKAVLGRSLTYSEMAKLCGLSATRTRGDGVVVNNGADTIRKWEEGDGPSGPVDQLVKTYATVLDQTASQALRDAMAAQIMKRLRA